LTVLTIPDFRRARVLVVGDLMLDRYWFGATRRISPEAPVPVVQLDGAEDRPGGAANVAVNLAAIGVSTRLVGLIGEDEAGRELERLCGEDGIVCEFVAVPDRPTVSKLRVLSRNQQLIRLDAEERFGAAASARLLGPVEAALGGVDAVVLSDYGKGTLANVGELVAVCREAGVPVVVDPKGTDFERYAGAFAITPNLAEFEAVVGPAGDEETLLSKAATLRESLGLDALLVTRSERGMTLVQAGDEAMTLAAEAREVFDVTGAGDTVIAMLAAGLAAGTSVADAARLANLAAGLVVRKIGVASVTPAELRLALHRRGMGGRGLVGADELVDLVAEARERGERVVMTNGCFDILHAGHVAYLEEAKSLGDRLIVAVNDDASVARLKGAGRPVNALDDRMSVLAGLAAVDWVVPFGDDTPEALISRVLPDVLVKGGDYRIEEIAGGRAVLEAGGEVRVLAFRQGRSTSRIIDAIREQG
jgi:D-beta-D-heptose 7-phosphate kinase/D-beta-D-heptose 1-phosphate adenosyltransferase